MDDQTLGLTGSFTSHGSLIGTLSSPGSLSGRLSNPALRGERIELRVNENNYLQYRYEGQDDSQWQDLIELNNLNYEELINKPSINDITLIGNLTPEDLGLSTRSEGIATISRSGLTYTVTRPDGSTFSFDQLDQENVIESVSVNGTQLAVSNKNVDVTVPTAVSQLTNDSNYATQSYVDSGIDSIAAAMPTKVSDLTNDSNFTTQTYVDTELEKKQDTLPMGEVTSADIGKALMPKTVENGEVTSWEFGEAGMVDDVTINGTSIVSNKVAEIPVADTSTFGVVKTRPAYGIRIQDGYLTLSQASEAMIKAGATSMNAIVPQYQHESVFYGLAKIAGSDEKDSTLSVGTYTDEAKSAIQTMLGVPSASDVVTDVQVRGTSVTSDGVAEIPVATIAQFGVTKIGSGLQSGSDGQIMISRGTLSQIKEGVSNYAPIVPSGEHYATFYGLAKAAGSDEKNSTLPVGTYTDAAKTAIQSMLGIDTAIANAVGQITGFDFSVVQELPASGVKGIIYLVAHSHGDNDGYDEYIWINDGFEKLGHADIDLSNYVTFDDYATTSTAGVVKVNSSYGIASSVNGTTLSINKASSANIKAGTEPYKPITPANQNESAFYGLAKAAGDSTQSASANAVGTYTDDAKTAIQTMLGVPADDEVVKDVQINGTSIVSNGAANIPIASASNLGVMLVSSAYGISVAQANGNTYIYKANSSETKAGSNQYRPIVPYNQHESAFYGLAKAAGDTTQSQSSNAVGTYTDTAKTAIKSMLGINDGIEVVRLA